jgi:aminopeptidase N
LIYLSTLAYIDANQRPANARTETQRTFFSELLHAHEVAHQWWGNLVTSDSYQDDWVMEALANYEALMFLEKKKGRKALEEVLGEYRDNLLSKDAEGETLESAGPIIWGLRLISSQSPRAWRMITYEKGSWIIHMLRMRMGDAAFLKMLGEVVRRQRYKSLTTDRFREIAAEFMPARSDDPKLESFFESWVYGTGVPEIKLSYTVTGKAPKMRVRGTVTQSDVAEDFTALVPVEVQLPGRKPIVQWVRTSSDAVPFSIDVPRAPSKVAVASGQPVLAAK